MFYCVYQHLRATCQNISHWRQNVYTRSFRKGKSFFTLFPNGIFMRTMFHVPCFRWNVLLSKNFFVEPSMWISLVSCVVQWKANIFYFSHSFIFLFREYHSQFSCCVYIFSRPQTQTWEKKKGENKKTLGKTKRRKEEKEKTFPTLNAFSKLLFVFFFVFPSFPFSRLRTFHWLGTTKQYLLLKSSHYSFALSLSHSLSPPQFLVVVKTTTSMMWIS